MYKVFHNDNVIILNENSCSDLEYHTSKRVENKKQLFQFLDSYFKSINTQDICISGYNLTAMINDFKSWFKCIKAAGGLVKNTDNKYLFIKRFGIWDLPKGKVELNELMEAAAIREVCEETGVKGLRIFEQVQSTNHIYLLEDDLILKCTNWYLMETDFNNETKPQIKEGITDVAWLTSKQSKKAMASGYRSLNEILAPYLNEK